MEATQQQQQPTQQQAQVQSQHTGSLVRASASGRAAASGSSSGGSSLLSRYQLLSTHYNLSDNVDLLSSVIAHRYNQGEYAQALELCEKVQEIDPFHLGILPTFLACLVSTQQKSRLYFVAHRLVAAYPDRAVSWHAVGCYYLLLGALDVARRFFYKATRIDGLFPYAWLGFGHTFSYQDESEQALLSYRTAQRLFEGAHTPLLYMGQEYLKTNHLVLAEHFLALAQRCHPHDPLAHNETGVIAFKNGEFQEAVRHFLRCIQLVKPTALANWEATLFNLGHAYRKLKSVDTVGRTRWGGEAAAEVDAAAWCWFSMGVADAIRSLCLTTPLSMFWFCFCVQTLPRGDQRVQSRLVRVVSFFFDSVCAGLHVPSAGPAAVRHRLLPQGAGTAPAGHVRNRHARSSTQRSGGGRFRHLIKQASFKKKKTRSRTDVDAPIPAPLFDHRLANQPQLSQLCFNLYVCNCFQNRIFNDYNRQSAARADWY